MALGSSTELTPQSMSTSTAAVILARGSMRLSCTAGVKAEGTCTPGITELRKPMTADHPTNEPRTADCTWPGCGLPDHLHGSPDGSRVTWSQHYFCDSNEPHHAHRHGPRPTDAIGTLALKAHLAGYTDAERKAYVRGYNDGAEAAEGVLQRIIEAWDPPGLGGDRTLLRTRIEEAKELLGLRADDLEMARETAAKFPELDPEYDEDSLSAAVLREVVDSPDENGNVTVSAALLREALRQKERNPDTPWGRMRREIELESDHIRGKGCRVCGAPRPPRPDYSDRPPSPPGPWTCIKHRGKR